MAQAALALTETAAANDNVFDRFKYTGPPTEGDMWRWIIAKLTSISTTLGVWAAQRKLAGLTIDQFRREFFVNARAAGWAECQPGGLYYRDYIDAAAAN